MATISEALAIAAQHQQAGRLQAAEQICGQILAVEPNQPAAIHLLGVIAFQAGKHQAGVECIRRALVLRPNWAEAHNNLGNALRETGQLGEAVACYRRTLELKPDLPDAHNNLGNALRDQGKLDEAVACFRRALELKPDYARAHYNLGVALEGQGKLDEAVTCYRRAAGLEPDFAEAHHNLGAAVMEQGKLNEAVASYHRALELKPDFAEAHNNLGAAFKDQGKLDEAVACYRRALELKPDFAEAHNNLGTALRDQGKLDDGLACYRRALELKPDSPDAHYNLGNALREEGKLDEALACYRRALELKPDDRVARDNLLCSLQYCPNITPGELAEAHADYERCHAAGLRTVWRPHDNVRDCDRALRLGFLSPDLHRHPVGFFLVRVLENLDRRAGEIVCYSDRPERDDLTSRMEAAATTWRDVAGWSDQQLADQIRADRVDILFDLAGHTDKNRLLVFARKPAPVQITWIGYEGTTGLTAMDYLLADRYVAPEGSRHHYRERLLWMPHGYLCYDPPAAPEVGPLPSVDKGYATFGSFNNPAKISPRVIEVWAAILRRVPRSKLMLKYKRLDIPAVTRRFAEAFAAQGVGPQQLELCGASPYAEYLAAYREVDVALDPFPFSGSTTTCEALWMGVPVITCPGETFAGRHSLSHLSNIGLTETIASDLENYIELAVGLAGDLPRLAALRAGLRQRVADSPLCDGKRFAVNLTGILRGVWHEWCRGKHDFSGHG